jgi:carboxypeptidase family protein
MTTRLARTGTLLTSWALALALLGPGVPGPRAAADDPAPSATPAEPAPSATPAKPAPDAPARRSVFGTIVGAVLDIKKKPMAGCMVQLSSRGEGATLRVTGTDEKGHYVFKDLPAGVYDIEVAASGDVSSQKGKIEVRPPFRNIIDFEFGPHVEDRRGAAQIGEALKKATGAGVVPTQPESAPGEPVKMVPVRGTFLDVQKRPIPEVSVMLLSLAGTRTMQAFSGEDGTFLIPEVQPGRYRVLVSAPGYVSLDLKTVVVSAVSGLNLGLSLVDYPLNFKSKPEDRLPPEEPLQSPPASR